MAQVKQFSLRRDPSHPAYVVLREHMVAARKVSGLTQDEVAKRIGKPQSFIAKVERGERYLDVVEFAAIARIIGLNADEVIAAVANKA